METTFRNFPPYALATFLSTLSLPLWTRPRSQSSPPSPSESAGACPALTQPFFLVRAFHGKRKDPTPPQNHPLCHHSGNARLLDPARRRPGDRPALDPLPEIRPDEHLLERRRCSRRFDSIPTLVAGDW